MAYEKNGIQYPSVTTILGILDKPALLSWASNSAVNYIEDNIDAVKDPLDVHRGEEVLELARTAYKKISKDACDSGSMTHHAIEAYINGLEYEYILQTEESRNGFEAFLSWESKNHVEWLESEVEIIDEEIGYGGRFDAIARVNGHIYLIDFKTSKSIYDEMAVQLCAYRQTVNKVRLEAGLELIENIAVLHLNKETAEPTFKPFEKDLERKTAFFNALVNVYYLEKNRRLKNNPFVKKAKEGGLK